MVRAQSLNRRLSYHTLQTHNIHELDELFPREEHIQGHLCAPRALGHLTFTNGSEVALASSWRFVLTLKTANSGGVWTAGRSTTINWT